MRKVRHFVALAAISAVLVACTSGAASPSSTTAPASQSVAPGGESPSAPGSAAARPRVDLKFGSSSSLSFPDVPTQAALEKLAEEQNIHVEHVEFESGDQTIRAVVSGQIDVGTVFPSGIMAAARDGDVKLFFNTKANEWSLVCRSDINSPAELTGKKIGRHSPNDLTAALLGNTIQKYNVQPELLTIPGSENRVVALLQGQIDCSPVDIAGLFVLEDEKPGGFKPILRYADDMPGLIYTQHVVANTNAIEADKETWELLVRYLMESFRQASEDPDYLASIADKYLPAEDPELHRKIAEAYVDYKAFTRDGGLTKERMDKLIQFYVDSGVLAEADVLPFEEYATTELVDAAIAEIGP